MDIIFIETPSFIRKFDKIGSIDGMFELQNELTENPEKGSVVKGSGGARKIRMPLKGRGKSGGARILYYFVDLRGEVWFLDIFTKSDKANISDYEKKKLYKFIKEVIK